ncbi:MAG: PQQ-dependent sugar dehydrogenase, partial [Novosphingobium sp.]|uniref:PQQ-dependent sugar dehydrogenase n=1 Tax=Novosphingobium sp. TaxID=1874826 RepID=UPI003C7AA7B0
MRNKLLTALSSLALIAASCGASTTGDSKHPAAAEVADAFKVEVLATFDEPWAMSVNQFWSVALVTEKSGKLKCWSRSGVREIEGGPQVDYGGQGGLGDVAFRPGMASSPLVYFSWVESGPNGTRGAVVGRGVLGNPCLLWLGPIEVIWRQTPKVTGRGHFSHRLAFSPDGKYLFVASGERQKFTPAQDLSNNLGKVLRLNLDGTPAAGNPFANKGGVSAEIWSYGHRNILGLQFDAEGRLWALEHGPAGGDELNLIKPGQNYGWTLVSD